MPVALHRHGAAIGMPTILCVAGMVLACPPPLLAQRHGGSDSRNTSPSSGGWGSDSGSLTSEPQPYGGQIYCPVTGTKLGLTQPPVAVQTTIGETKPSFFEKLFGKKGSPGAVIYVCCPRCAEIVRQDPMRWMQEVIADKGCFDFWYGKAPAQRPPRAGVDVNKPAPAVAGNGNPDTW
jgi:hypothetical protein